MAFAPRYNAQPQASGNVSSPIGGGGNSATLVVQPSNTSSYWVRITNACGAVNSNTATVFVNP